MSSVRLVVVEKYITALLPELVTRKSKREINKMLIESVESLSTNTSKELPRKRSSSGEFTRPAVKVIDISCNNSNRNRLYLQRIKRKFASSHLDELNRVPTTVLNEFEPSSSLNDISPKRPHLRDCHPQLTSMMSSWRHQSIRGVSLLQQSRSSENSSSLTSTSSTNIQTSRNISLRDAISQETSTKTPSTLLPLSHSVPATLCLQTDNSFKDWLEMQFSDLHNKIDSKFNELKAMITTKEMEEMTEEVCKLLVLSLSLTYVHFV